MTPARLVLTDASLIDAVTPGVTAGASVTVEGGRIVEVLDGRRSPTTQGAQVIDLGGRYLLPGLWDAHVHLEWPRLPQAGVPELTAQYLANAQRALLWVKSGASPWHTLQAATKHAAEVCGVGSEVGTVEAGKLADLIVVRDNPLDDIDNVRSLDLVFKAGRLVADHSK